MKQYFLKPARVFSEYFKIRNIIFTSIQLEVEVLNQYRQFYNPNKFFAHIEKAYKASNLIKLITAISFYCCNAFLFYFLPFWILSLPLYLFINLKIWKSAWLKMSFSISEYKVWTKHSLMVNFKGTLDFKIIISFFPFIFGISYVIYSRYQNQVFPYFIQKNLPGVYPSFPRLKWDTFQNITSYQLTKEPLLPNKNSLFPKQIAHVTSLHKLDSKIIDVFAQSENKNEVFNFNSPSNYRRSSVQAGDCQPQIIPTFKFNRFIKQLDFYTDSFLIKLNSAWLNKKKQVYIGLFPKKYSLQSAPIDTNLFLHSSNKYQIGNNWHLVSPKEYITFSAVVPTKFFSQEVSFAAQPSTGNQLITSTRRVKLINSRLINQFRKSAPLSNQNNFTLSELGLWQGQSYTKNVDLQVNPSIKNYWEAFYLNLDELPKKLNSRSLLFSSDNLSNWTTDETLQLLPLQNYLDEYKNFLSNLFVRDTKNPHQMATKKFVNKKKSEVKFQYREIPNLFNLLPHGSSQRKKVVPTEVYNIVKKSKLIASSFFLNKVAPKSTLNLKNRLSRQTIDGFSAPYPLTLFPESSLIADFLLINKFNFLQNQLRQYFYNNGLHTLPNVRRLAPNLDTYKSVLPLLLGKDFLINESPVSDQNNQAQNIVSLGFSDFPIKTKEILESNLIQPEKALLKKQQEITNLKNTSKVLLTHPTLEQREILSKLQDYCSEQILHILQNFGPLKINFAIQPRMMSGYEFPDTSSIELRSLILQHFYQTIVSSNNNPLIKDKRPNKFQFFSPIVKVELPPSFTSYLNYNYSNPKIPSFKLNYRPTFLQGVKKILYEGPGVLRDNLTQDLTLTNKQEIQQWIKQFLSSDNPLTDRREVFFGHNLTKVVFTNNELASKNHDKQTTFLPKEQFIADENRGNSSAAENLMSISTLYVQNSDLDINCSSNLTPNRAGQGSPPTVDSPSASFLTSSISTKADAEIQKVKKHIGQPLIEKTGKTKSSTQTKLNSVNLPILPFSEEFQVPYLNKSEWQTILEKLKANLEEQLEDKSELEKKFQVDVPLIRIRNPKQQNIQWPLNQLDYTNLNDFIVTSKTNSFNQVANLGQKSNSSIIFGDITYQTIKEKSPTSINYHYLPSAQILLNDNLVKKRTFANIYKKAFTLYKDILENNYESLNQDKRKNYATKIFVKNFSTVFYQSWEPITTGSWMMITQLSFGLVVLQILQEFYRKYGKELISYLLDLIASLGIIDDTLKDELEIDDGRKGFRLIRNVPKRFRDIAGIDNILPELGEIVWFLRNSGRSFKVGNIIPKGILLIGSPGTGKTLLVQAIAGEAEVPVLVQCGSSLNDPDQEGDGAQNLQNLFEQARQLAPCIVFIDEIDALGEKRENVIQNPMGTDEIIESIQEHINSTQLSTKQLILKPKIKFGKSQSNNLDSEPQNLSAQDEGSFINQNLESSENVNLGIMQQSMDKQEAKQEQLSLLMQFLIEMDGLRARKGVIVIGATNRPEVLDLALTRPGRFDQTLQLGLPEKQKRIEILKLYSKNLGTVKNISWEYLANRTVGFSAADLAAVMNESSMKAILGETIHTIETIEKGIESITSYSSENLKRGSTNCVDPFFISRLAYYQAGKAVVHTLLLQHPSITVLHLWPKKKNARHTYISSIIQNKFLRNSRKLELESRVVGLYAGKAAELLILSNNLSARSEIESLSRKKNLKPNLMIVKKTSTFRVEQSNRTTENKSLDHLLERQQPLFHSKKLWQSDIGIEDLNFATYLVESMISQWYFYSKNLVVRNSNQIFHQRNLQEIQDLDTIDLFNELAIETETTILKKTRSSGLKRDFQRWSIRPWWQTQITQQIGVLDPAYDDWYRIYLPDPEESERNEEWILPDEYYHNNNQLSDLALNSNTCSVNWNDLYVNDRDYISHGLLLTCFNSAFTILDKNRELLDYLASYLMRNDILREHEMNDILLQFKPEIVSKTNNNLFNLTQGLKSNKNYNKSKAVTEKIPSLTNQHHYTEQNYSGCDPGKASSGSQQQRSFNENKNIRIIEKSWGPYSRRRLFHFFTF